jgi:hypothetical protein
LTSTALIRPAELSSRANFFSRIRVFFTQLVSVGIRHKISKKPASGRKKQRSCHGRKRFDGRSRNEGPQATSSFPPF